MKLRIALSCCLALAACSRDLELPDPPPTTAFLTGRVVGAVPGTAVSAPLANVQVTLLNTNISGTTDERGNFVLGPLPSGTFRVFFSTKLATGTRQRIINNVSVRTSLTNNLGDVSLQENALLTGRSLIQGRTSGNIGITIFSPGTDYVTTSADNGGYLLSNLPEGSIRATAWRPGFTPATTTDIDLQGGVVTSAVDLILEPELMSAPAGSIIGSVTVLGREDFSGVTVKAISATTREVRATVSTDAQGRFTLPSLASDLYVVTVELTGYPSARIPNLAVAGGVQLELEPIVLAVQNSGNTGTDNPIGGPSGPLFNLDGGVTQPDGGDEDGGAIGAECTVDNECASGRLCINNRCIGCSVNVQCRPGYSCQAGDCVRDCMNNDECPNGLACIAGACVGCITSSDCRDPALICNSQQRCAQCTSRTECPVGKACLPTGCGDCMNDLDCGAGAICEQGVCTAGNCHGNTDCAPNEACVGRMCTGCTSDSQCRSGQLCINNACVTGNCRSVLECGTGQVCQGNQCGPCANDMQCGTGQLCLPGTNGLRCTAATCRVNGDCTGASAGLQCVNNSCQPCGTNTPCGSGQICNAQGRCVVGDCFTNLDCTGTKAGWACLGGNCTPCGTNADCGASGYVCDQGLCRVGNCVSPTDCALTGQLCVNNACVGCGAMNPCPSGQVCDSDSLCHPGNCIVTADCPAMSNLVCVNRFCSACTTDTQCGSGKLCIGGQCRVGNCRLPSDCSVAGQICAANTCSSCTTSTQCGSGQICDVDGLCHTGNCVSGSVCPGNQLCVSNVCTPCTMDTQCLGTQICFNGGCITGNCHSDADCSSGTRICDQGTHACRSCNNPGTVNSNDCGGMGRVCDLGGSCRTGNCLTSANCSGGLVCVNFNCTTCTADNQCGSGQLCVNNACKNGNCHGTGADPNIDCAATNGVCVVTVPNNTCVGNCRSNADCGATGFCNTTTHFCGACTAPGQCGPGKVCGTGGICVTGQCSPLEPNCAGSESCVGNTCMQVGPSAQADGGGYTNPGVFSVGQRAPMVLSGNNTLYFSASESSAPTGAGVYVTALEPNLSVRWRIRSGTGGATKDNFAGAGIVVPAPGFPNNELFVTTDGNSGLTAMAHRSDNGATVWTLPTVGLQSATFATGLANGIPQIAWISGNVVGWMRTDGTNPRSATLTPSCSFLAFTFGTNGIYAVCAEGVYLVDPVSGTVKVVPHNGNPGLNLPNGFATGIAAIWRPPNNYVTRGVDAGIVNSDIVIYSGSRSAAPSITVMLAVRIPDDWVTNPTSTSTWTLWGNSTINANTSPTAIDSTGALYLHNAGAQFYKINVYDGSVIAASAPNNIATLWNVGSNGQLISTTAGLLAGYFIGDGQTAPATPVWTLPSTPGAYPNLTPNFQATSTNFGNLLAFQGTATPNQYVLRSLAPAPTAPSFVPTWPAWSQGGDAQNHNTAPAYQCTSNAQCASNETCMLGRCGGTCRDATQCPAGQGCSMVSCQACTKASQCRSGEVCWAGTCQACTGMNCCSTTADCTPGNFCQAGQCRSQPQSGVPGAFGLPSATSRSSTIITVAPDGTTYVADNNGSAQPFWRAVTPGGAVAFTTPVVPVGLNSRDPILMVANTGPTTNAIVHGASSQSLYWGPTSSSFGSWTSASYASVFGSSFLRIAQGMSSATGSSKPAIFATATTNVSPNFVLGIDAALSSAGGANAGLLWSANLGTCNVQGTGTQQEHLLVGSDSTVYVWCSDGTLTAWAPDGDTTTGPVPRAGLLKWRTAAPSWGGTAAGRPAIGKTMTGDVIYLPRSLTNVGLAIVNTATAFNGSAPIEVNVDATTGVLTNSAGQAIVFGQVSPREVAVVNPNGSIAVSDKVTWNPLRGPGAVLTADNLLVIPEVSRVSAVLVSPTQLVPLFSVNGVGNIATDANTGVYVLSTSQVAGGLLGFDHLPISGSPPRTLTGMPFANNPGPMPNAWSTTMGDLQRRNSLKTQ